MEDKIPYDQSTSQRQSDDAMDSFERRIIAVQRRLKAPKSSFNSFGGYYFRSCEDILEGLKPLLEEYDLLVTINDELLYLEGRFYVKATVTVTDVITRASKQASAYAREPENRKGSDQSQVTGSTSSYARKYALNAIFLTDDNKDADTPQSQGHKEQVNQQPAQNGIVFSCENCGTTYQFQTIDQYRGWVANANCCANPKWPVI